MTQVSHRKINCAYGFSKKKLKVLHRLLFKQKNLFKLIDCANELWSRTSRFCCEKKRWRTLPFQECRSRRVVNPRSAHTCEKRLGQNNKLSAAQTGAWECTLTVSASMTSRKFLFPTTLFLMAFIASLGLYINKKKAESTIFFRTYWSSVHWTQFLSSLHFSGWLSWREMIHTHNLVNKCLISQPYCFSLSGSQGWLEWAMERSYFRWQHSIGQKQMTIKNYCKGHL